MDWCLFGFFLLTAGLIWPPLVVGDSAGFKTMDWCLLGFFLLTAGLIWLTVLGKTMDWCLLGFFLLTAGLICPPLVVGDSAGFKTTGVSLVSFY